MGVRSFVRAHPFVETTARWIINLPVVGGVYRKLYASQIKKIKDSPGMGVFRIETINTCNLKCVMCTYPMVTRKKEIMSMDLYKKIINESAELGVKRVSLQNYGEPLLDPHIFDRIKYAKSKGLKTSFYTNATFLRGDVVDKVFDSGLDIIKFSLDAGDKETYEKIRLGGDWKQVKKNVISFYNRREELGLKTPQILIRMVKQESNKDKIGEYKKFWKKYSDIVDVSPVDNRTGDEIDTSRKTAYPCFIGKNLVILSNGDVVICCIDYDGKLVVGNVKKQTLKEIINSERFKKVVDAHMKFKGDELGICKNCVRLYENSAFKWWLEAVRK